ncbi:auxin-induced protein 6B-like [Olea europaea var. sylvestris]|uniref:auxin-induced protein 6B-like n=1 Tax=Olea europaea var. sylvestris TaxID=158386 RepID=UPI000C1CDA97|nr:auxin-induced protein 6B-like [Olea europaea var. sylvestris]
MQEEKKKMKLKKGWVAVEVGLADDNEFQRFVIPISYLYHPLFQRLLDEAREVYGYHTTGPLRLPCSVDDFLDIQCRIERETTSHSYGRRRHHHQLSMSLSFNSC